MKPDITSREDIKTLITHFYDKVRKDELLGPVFQHVDWEHHTPIIIDFWSSILLGDQTYKRNPFAKHVDLGIGMDHFDRWLSLFQATLSENFSGEKTTEAMARAQSIAGIFQHKLGLL